MDCHLASPPVFTHCGRAGPSTTRVYPPTWSWWQAPRSTTRTATCTRRGRARDAVTRGDTHKQLATRASHVSRPRTRRERRWASYATGAGCTPAARATTTVCYAATPACLPNLSSLTRALHAADGEWRNDLRHGRGVASWVSGLRYEGSWKEDKTEGDGEATYPKGDKYVGEWHIDQRCARCAGSAAVLRAGLAEDCPPLPPVTPTLLYVAAAGAGAASIWRAATASRASGSTT